MKSELVVSFLLQVYKILVRKTHDESWVVFRRYTDFSRLNDKVPKKKNISRLSDALLLLSRSSVYQLCASVVIGLLCV